MACEIRAFFSGFLVVFDLKRLVNRRIFLFRTVRDSKMSQFFARDFTVDRWRKAALKNAYSLLGKQRFDHAAAFFLLAGSLWDAIQVGFSLRFIGCNVTCYDSNSVTQHITYKHSIESSSVYQYFSTLM